jgi:hypothetical protein
MANVPICVCNFIPIQVSSKTNRIIMWTEEKLMKAAQEWVVKLTGEYYFYAYYDSTDVKEAFLAGAKFIINNTQK